MRATSMPNEARRASRLHAVREDRGAPSRGECFDGGDVEEFATTRQCSASAQSSWKCVANNTSGDCSSRPTKNSQIACAIARPSSCPGSAAHLVDQEQGARGAPPQDVRRLSYLHVERRLARCEIVAGADSREDPVDDPERHRLRGNERADLCHDRQQAGLSQIGGFAAHIRPGQQNEAMLGRAEVKVVGHEVCVQHRLHYRVAAPVFDCDDALLREYRAHVSAFGGTLRERREHVHLRDRASRTRKFVGTRGNPFERQTAVRAAL